MLCGINIQLCEVYTVDDATYTVGQLRSEHYVAGTVPAAWEQAGAFPVLQTLYFSNTLLAGTLPSAWGSRAALHELQYMSIKSCNITGESAVMADSIQSSQSTNLCI